MSLYFWINCLSISIPLLVSFHPRIALHQKFHWLALAIVLSMTPYIIWDVYFTRSGYWGFNDAYLSGVYFLDLPLEEWLFFICIPFACVFTHYSLLELNSKIILSEQTTRWISYFLIVVFLFMAVFNLDRSYTLVDMGFALVILMIVYWFDRPLLRSYYLTFLAMLVPFFLVNGVLTGSFILDEVVWYNDVQNLGIRIGTIPIEDTAYAFSLILFNLFLFRRLIAINSK